MAGLWVIGQGAQVQLSAGFQSQLQSSYPLPPTPGHNPLQLPPGAESWDWGVVVRVPGSLSIAAFASRDEFAKQ